MVEFAPDGRPIYELGDPEAIYGASAFGSAYLIVRPPSEPADDDPT